MDNGNSQVGSVMIWDFQGSATRPVILEKKATTCEKKDPGPSTTQMVPAEDWHPRDRPEMVRQHPGNPSRNSRLVCIYDSQRFRTNR
jgi:hypothetical protein